MWTSDLNTPYHQQDVCYYCGAACAQMILEGIGAGIISQDDLYQANHNPQVNGWYTYPPRIGDTINRYAPVSFLRRMSYQFFQDIAAEDACRRLVLSVQMGYPAPVVVNNCAHMIVARGASTHEEPTTDGPLTIYGFFVNDPWPPCPSTVADCQFHPNDPPPPPHSDTDECGTGTDRSGHDRGSANEYKTISDWLEDTFTECRISANGGPFLTAVPVAVDSPLRNFGNFPRKSPVWVPPLVKVSDFVKPQELTRVLKESIDRELGDHSLGKLAKKATPGSAVLVQRLDRPDSFYFLVPLLQKDRITGIARFDALRGTLLGMRALAGRQTLRNHPLFAPRNELVQRALGDFFPLGKSGGRVRLRKGAYEVYPTMVWQSTPWSRSPYYPFHMITTGSHRAYVSLDGAAHSGDSGNSCGCK